jgi:hypothetical protein
MSNEPNKADLTRSYAAMTEGELLALASEQETLEEGAKEALAAELQKRDLGETQVIAFQQDTDRAKARQERWRKVQRLRLWELFASLLFWPGVMFIPFLLAIGLIFALGPILRDMGHLNQHHVILCQQIAAIGVVVLCIVAIFVLILSDRTDVMSRRWFSDSERKPKSAEEKLRAHRRICPAHNFGYALLLLLVSLYFLFLSLRDVEGWHILRDPSPQVGWSYVNAMGGILLIVFCLYLAIKAPCIREKLWFAFATAEYVLDLPKQVFHSMSGHELDLARDISLFLWAAATIVALSLVKSAWQGPVIRNFDRQDSGSTLGGNGRHSLGH